MSRNLSHFVLLSVTIAFVASAAAAQESGSVPLRNPRWQVEQQYEALGSLTLPDRRLAYAGLPGDMKADLWTAHLYAFLRKHPELSADQRSVVYEALGYIASGEFQADLAKRDGLRPKAAESVDPSASSADASARSTSIAAVRRYPDASKSASPE